MMLVVLIPVVLTFVAITKAPAVKPKQVGKGCRGAKERIKGSGGAEP